MKKKILFRADGNTITGLGHLYRLFALAEVYKQSYEYTYITKSSSTVEVIPEDYNIVVIDKQIDLLEEPLWLASRYNPEEHIIIADGYHFTSSYQKSIKDLGFSLIFIDDLAKEHMYADIVINHSSSSQVSDFKSEDYTQFALGTEYSLLRPAFLELAKEKRTINKINTAFICFGGADKFNFSYQTAKVLLEIDQVSNIHIVIGAAYNGDEINELKHKFPQRIRVYRNLSEKELIKVMKLCNLAIAPTSTILYELLCVKMPIISGYFVENQKSVYNWFNQKKCFYGIGDFCDFDFKKLKDIIVKFSDVSLLQSYINNQSKCIDGNQKERFLKLVNNL
ncbi:UDP-2,4-diacetamido-2,4,6-trideoxy-beta-L-altropyranose hydrolase [Aquimarina sp. 2201CG5-10]|uniref:UDP-2,4-diacetamido-2,4, 6-trideoxy-beta-L-altropyranose hydrolase n=1 Tax=Aquimarina callyspongiae TaxID=3098150 RepID=UPI002AB5DAD4|nr:UDP-2,4-diacetamido-2,4,6-trideoxy-beta-L-altropyranose hydrolase [Aquimarina sp. 2201CG5-10]MDY8138675.1 UDP-2,4-diacetamido-2,4,6-trideoxy-beta-L-altropyranose hydrolase [Aquimarina sp. 2201CG5-10]